MRRLVQHTAGRRGAIRLVLRRGYTSYPDPNEKPQISTFLSTAKRTILDKKGKEYELDEKFRLDSLFPGVPPPTGITAQAPPPTLSTRLPSGLTVATQEMHGLMSSFAFVVSVGSSSETQVGQGANTGATQMVELTAFGATLQRSQQEISAEMEQLGGMVQCVSSREQIMFCVDVLRENVERAMELLADTVLHPRLDAEDVAQATEIVLLQQTELPADLLSRDAVTMAAFKGSPLGNAHYCPPEGAKRMNKDTLRAFRAKHFVGDNCLVSAAGVEHAPFVALVERLFSSLPPGNRGSVGKPVYTGGMVSDERPLQEPYVKVALAFAVGGWKHEQLVGACVLQQLLGGGSSFSAGGPGKGMYTRLYREMLNQHHWVESAESFLVIHDDAGLLGIDGACAPEYVKELIREIVYHLARLCVEPVSDEELSRAKNMLKSMMLMQLESRLVVCEDIARQFAIYGRRAPPEEICAKIDLVSKEDILRLAAGMMEGAVSVGAAGHDLSHLPPYADIASFVRQMRDLVAKQRG